jgi:hypothetical protein
MRVSAARRCQYILQQLQQEAVKANITIMINLLDIYHNRDILASSDG